MFAETEGIEQNKFGHKNGQKFTIRIKFKK